MSDSASATRSTERMACRHIEIGRMLQYLPYLLEGAQHDNLVRRGSMRYLASHILAESLAPALRDFMDEFMVPDMMLEAVCEQPLACLG